MSSLEVVNRFMEAWSNLDLPAIEMAVSDDIYYQNIPFAAVAQLDELRDFGDSVHGMVSAGTGGIPITPIVGRPAFSKFLETIKAFEWAHWQVNSIAADGDKVFTDRVDTFGLTGGGRIAIGVIGIFEVQDGLIRSWRDLFNLKEFQSQLKALA